MEIIIFTDINNTYGFGRDAGAYRIATELRSNGFAVQVIDFFASLTIDDVKNIVDKFVGKDTIMVAFSTTHFARNTQELGSKDLIEMFSERLRVYSNCECFPQSDSWIEELQSIFLKKNSSIKFIVGGERAVTAPKEKYNIDHWVMGQADKSIVELANALKSTTSFPQMVYSDRDYKFDNFSNSKIKWTNNDLLFDNEHLPIEVARGCSFNCPFCSYRKKFPSELTKDNNVLKDELLYNYEKFGITGYMIMDPVLNSSIKKLESICNVFNSLPFKIEWSAFARLDLFSKFPQMRDIILESGARSIQFGIETMNDKTMKVIRKGISSSRTKELLYYLNETWNKKVISGSFFIIGLPEETEEDLYKNMEWILDKNCPLHSVSIGILTIRKYNEKISKEVVFSEFSKNMPKYGYSDNSKNWKNDKTGLTRERCFEIFKDLTFKNMNRKTIDFYYYSRMRNLGYSFEDLWPMRKDYDETFNESNKIKDKIRDKYFGRLFNL